MARKLTIERERIGALSDADFWTLSIGPGRAPSPAELRRLEAVWQAHQAAGLMGAPHCWGWWQFESGLNDGHAFSGELYFSWLWLEQRRLLTTKEASGLAFARARRDELDERHPAATAAEYRRAGGYDVDDYRADPLGEARRRRARWLQKETTT